MKIKTGLIYRDAQHRSWYIETKLKNPKHPEFPYLGARVSVCSPEDPLGQRPLGLFALFNENGECNEGWKLVEAPKKKMSGFTAVVEKENGAFQAIGGIQPTKELIASAVLPEGHDINEPDLLGRDKTFIAEVTWFVPDDGEA